MNEIIEFRVQEVSNQALAVFTAPNGLDPILNLVATELMGFKADVSTPKGRGECASMAHNVARTKTAVEKVRKQLADEQKQIPKLIDAEGKRFRDAMDLMQEKCRAPLTAWEAEKAAKEAEEAAAIKKAEQDELDRVEAVRKAEFEAQAAALAAANAELARVQAVIDAQNAAAERAKQAEIESRQAIQRAIDNERAKVAAAQAQREAVLLAEKQEAEAKAADTEHRRAVNVSALNDFIACGFTKEDALVIVKAIASSKISNVTINY